MNLGNTWRNNLALQLVAVALLAAAAVGALVSLAGRPASALGPGELFVDADDSSCTDEPAEGAGATTTPFCTITAAIGFLDALGPTGGKLTLRPAVYDEGTITTNHGNFIIRGAPAFPRGSIVIKPGSNGAIGIHVTDPLGACDGVTIEHLTLDGSGHHANDQGILVDDVCDSITVRDVEVSNWGEQGILLADSSGDESTTASDGLRILDVQINDNGSDGIELFDGIGNSVEGGAIFENGRNGLVANRQSGLQVSGIAIEGNGLHGFHDIEGTNTNVEGNTISENLANGILLTGPHSGVNIESNTVSDNSAIGIQSEPGLLGGGGSDTTLSGNTVRSNGSHGIHVAEHEDLTIEDNEVLKNGGSGVFLNEGSGATVRDNDINENGVSGVVGRNQEDFTVRNNILVANGGDGVDLSGGRSNEVADNQLTDNRAAGLRSDEAVGLRVVDNTILDSATHGIELFDGANTTVERNDVRRNGTYGVVATRELSLSIVFNDISENAATGVRLVDGRNGRVIANADIADNGTEGSVEDYGISANGETNLLIEKNVLRRNSDAQIILDSSSDVQISKNDFVSAVDGIVFANTLASQTTGVVIGGSVEDGNRFRGLDPANNDCSTPESACYLEIPGSQINAGTIDATYNDWGTTNLEQIAGLICQEVPCHAIDVDFSNPLPPGDSPVDKGPVGLRGDADCNGVVNSLDAVLILQQSAGLLASVPCPANADANEDGGVNSLDAALVLQFSAGLISTLPP